MTFSYKMSMEAPLAFNSAERKGHTIVIIIIIVSYARNCTGKNVIIQFGQSRPTVKFAPPSRQRCWFYIFHIIRLPIRTTLSASITISLLAVIPKLS